MNPVKRLTFFLMLGCCCATAGAQTAADTAVTQVRQLLAPGRHLVYEYRSSLQEPRDLDTLEITARGDMLYFRGTGTAAVLNVVRFDLARNMALVRKRQLPFVQIFHRPAATSGFHTPVVTYAYEWTNHAVTDSTGTRTQPLETDDFGVSYQPQTGKTMVLLMTATGNRKGDDEVSQVQNVTFVIK